MIDENGSIIMKENQEADASGHLDNRNGVLPSVQAPPTVQGGKNMKRVLCLYRVSTPGQVDPNNDLPRQRRACQAYIDSHDDWVFSDERLEKGVSGFKLGVEKREVLQEIRTMASLHQFDVLLVFMLDRLGRKSFETPLFLLDLLEMGIEVWSTVEGQVTAEDQADMMKLFLSFWQGEGESRKTSTRVANAHKQMTEDGIWRGGSVPYGYRLEHLGRINNKHRMLYDVVIDEEKAEIVRSIFRMLCDEGMGTTRIANRLNELYPDPEKVWTQQTLRFMFHNPMYTGRLHMNDTVSEPIENLRIISDEQFAFANLSLTRHIQKRYTKQRQAENASLPDGIPSKTTVFGASMLSGILYCAHCGAKLVGGYCTKQLKNGPYHRPVYRCYNGSINAKNCDGQRVYSGRKLDEAVTNIAHTYFASIQASVGAVWQEQVRRQLNNSRDGRLKAMKANMAKLIQRDKALREEVLKSISGESMYDQKMLKEMLEENKAAREKLDREIHACRAEKDAMDAQIQHLSEQFTRIRQWADEFDSATVVRKKMILARLIEKITVDRNYHLTVFFFVTQEDFLQAAHTEDVDVRQTQETLQVL